MIRKLRAGLMPPAGARRPDAALLARVPRRAETRLDEMPASHPYAKAPELHRLNRREYRNAVRDLLDVDVDVSALLPPDARTGSFDNMADALTVNPALMQAYVRAADKVGASGARRPQAPPVMAKYNVPKVVNQMRHVEGAPFGTRGGTAVVHHFPADGEYTFQRELYYYYLGELIGGNLPRVAAGAGARDLDRRRARRRLHDRPAARRQHRHAGHAADHRDGRPAPRRGGVRRQGRRRRRGFGAPGRADDHRRQRRPAPGHDDAAAPADADRRRPDAASRACPTRRAAARSCPARRRRRRRRRAAPQNIVDHAGAARLPPAADQRRRRRR